MHLRVSGQEGSNALSPMRSFVILPVLALASASMNNGEPERLRITEPPSCFQNFATAAVRSLTVTRFWCPTVRGMNHRKVKTAPSRVHDHHERKLILQHIRKISWCGHPWETPNIAPRQRFADPKLYISRLLLMRSRNETDVVGCHECLGRSSVPLLNSHCM